jgi:hypothetical protein
MEFIIFANYNFTYFDGIKCGRICTALGSLSVHFIEFNLQYTGSLCSTYNYDAQNRQTQRDRIQADNDYQTNVEAKMEIKALQIHLNKIETEKLDIIVRILKKMQE